MPTPAESSGRRLAFVAATGSYTDTTLAKLRAPGRDAEDLAAVLEDAAVGGFEVETVLDAETEALRRRIARFCAQIGPRDLALVYLSCHGVLDDRGRLYYATTDTDHSILSATAISSAWLNEQLEDCRSRRQILVLDCCHSGAFAKGAKGDSALALGERFEGRGRVVLTGSRGTEYSFEHDHVVGDSSSSVFTNALVEGLRSGDADRNGDGMITVSELYEYAFDAVREKEARQTPTLWTYGAEGDLLVAHSPRGPIAQPQGPPALTPPPPSPVRSPPAPASPPPPERRRKVTIAAGSAAAVVAIAVAVALLFGGGEARTVSPSSPSPVGSQEFEVSGSPRGIAVGEGATWVSRYEDDKVSRIDPSSATVPISVGHHPGKVVAGEGSVWVSVEGGRRLQRIDPETHEITNERLVDTEGCNCPITEFAIADETLWASSINNGSLARFDLKTGEPLGEPLFPGGGFTGIFAVGEGAVWAASTKGQDRASSLIQIPTGSEVGTPKPLAGVWYIGGIAAGDGKVWIADAGKVENAVMAFDPEKEKVVKTIPIRYGILADDIAVSGESVIVWNPVGGWLTEIDASKMEVVKQQHVPGFSGEQTVSSEKSDLSVDESSAWVTNPAANIVRRVDY